MPFRGILETEFGIDATGDAVYVQEEPALEIALPQVFQQPILFQLHRGKVRHIEAIIARVVQRHRQEPEAPLGEDYQVIVNEFQPLFTWTTACWDYLLSTEGCRFVARMGENRFGLRGDYRVVTDKDYSRIVHRIFRQLLFAYGEQYDVNNFGIWLRQRFWPSVLEIYQALSLPTDRRQRLLTPYSYLRCVPYQFLNSFHQTLVLDAVGQLPGNQQATIHTYFFKFFTESATAEELGLAPEACQNFLQSGLRYLFFHHRLTYHLLLQIERY